MWERGREKGEVGEKASSPAATTIAAPRQTNGTAMGETKPDERALHQCLVISTTYSEVRQLQFLTALLSGQPSTHSKAQRISHRGRAHTCRAPARAPRGRGEALSTLLSTSGITEAQRHQTKGFCRSQPAARRRPDLTLPRCFARL